MFAFFINCSNAISPLHIFRRFVRSCNALPRQAPVQKHFLCFQNFKRPVNRKHYHMIFII